MDEQTEREAAINSLAYDTYMNGFAETTGDVEGPGHFALTIFSIPIVNNWTDPIVGVICCTDERGNEEYRHFTSADELAKEWDQIEEMVSTFYDDEDEPELFPTSPFCSIHEAPPEPGGLACEVRQSETWTGTE